MNFEEARLTAIAEVIAKSIHQAASIAISQLHPNDAISVIVGGLAGSVADLDDGELEKVRAVIEPCPVKGCDCHERRAEMLEFLIKARAYVKKAIAGRCHNYGRN